MSHEADTDMPKAPTKSGARRTIMPAYYKMSQDLGPLPKRFAAKRVRFLLVAILAVIAVVIVHHFWR